MLKAKNYSDYKSYMIEVDINKLNSLEDREYMLSIQPFNNLQGVQTFASEDFLTEKFLREKANLVQVTDSNQIFLVDLLQKNGPVVKDYAATDLMIDVDKFVNPGFTVSSITETTPFRTDK